MNDIIPAKNEIIHYTNIDFTQFKKLNIKIYISSNYEDVSK